MVPGQMVSKLLRPLVWMSMLGIPYFKAHPNTNCTPGSDLKSWRIHQWDLYSQRVNNTFFKWCLKRTPVHVNDTIFSCRWLVFSNINNCYIPNMWNVNAYNIRYINFFTLRISLVLDLLGGYLRPKMGMVLACSQGMGAVTRSFQA